jgi:hypothetical protein
MNTMKLREAIEILNAEAYYARDELLEADIHTARASDLMSEVLAEDAVPDLLLTGLCNTQVVRTAMVFGIKAVVFVRGRPMGQKMIDLALQENIVLMTTPESLFSSCGKLYSSGVRGVHLKQITRMKANK